MRVVSIYISLCLALSSCRNIHVAESASIFDASENSKENIYFIVSENEYNVKYSTFLVHGDSRVLSLNNKRYANFLGKGVIFVPSLGCYIFGTEKSGVHFVNLVYAVDGRILKIKTKYSFPNYIGAEHGARQEATLESIRENKLIFKRSHRKSGLEKVNFYEVDIESKIVSPL